MYEMLNLMQKIINSLFILVSVAIILVFINIAYNAKNKNIKCDNEICFKMREDKNPINPEKLVCKCLN